MNVRRVGLLSAAVLCGFMMREASVVFGEGPQLRQDRIAQVEEVLTHAAKRSPRWHSHGASIQREVQDITHLVEIAIKSGNPALVKEYAAEALALLRRAVSRGHFHPDDVAQVLTEIERLVPNHSL